MTVFVIGASSQIGHFFLPRIVATGRDVVALSRQPHLSTPSVRWLAGALPHMPDVGEVEAIVSFGPLDGLATWLADASLAGTPHVVATGSMSAETKKASAMAAERELSERLRASEVLLAESCDRRGMPWTVFRPTLIYGAGMDKSLTALAHRACATHVFPLLAGRGLRQPVHADDIAAAVVAAVERDGARRRIFQIGGSERLTSGDMFRRVRRSLSATTLPLPVPRTVLQLAARLLPGIRGAIDRLDNDLIADNADLIDVLGVVPRPFAPSSATWRLPDPAPRATA
ncbi:nucleoside-diphosphate-sugar epimerase [Luteibacter rhizovicinus]|uniref:Nucleoside-diphosphate-sugar epimerase n=1 Tax=Luteibacter rhizovicinus TaxID=242606 RepID=A0A4V2W3B4_9GAMM|nr:NAD-dependent epimerase/dehydratase family protein [Luteibacter rhizovicinus]TCV91299.1 nucleoside-diphosphate-sugar epimerase [Luteibacter rhizovicinus]